LRNQALQTLLTDENKSFFKSTSNIYKISDIYGKLVFNSNAMKKYISKDVLSNFHSAIEKQEKIDRYTADFIAEGMRNWALDNNVTHYTHWFQPMTGKTAEKHDTFFRLSESNLAIEEFSGKELIQQEPDASSFPSGGLRQTHQARGYTIWDPSSPVFIRETNNTRTMCIPSFFISYTGESLDLKTPLIKSINAVDKAATAVSSLFDESVARVIPTLGWEQEYFVIDEALFNTRPDLVLCGRTLYGKASPRGQQLEDHYFGTIPERVSEFMSDFEYECYRLGIPIKTRHNEVAPTQFECAPHFEFANIAADHNQYLMDIIDLVAKRHKLRILLHEKPFAGLNGSGKHNNWSLMNDKGENLLNPGDNPADNLRFLTFFVCTISAVYKHADLLRAAIANAGNEHRLGANEAPPAIISIFIGDYLTNILENVNNLQDEKIDTTSTNSFTLNIERIANLELDSNDRNRTSPFAFTSNKFEFRAVGSSVNVSKPITILNTIVADELNRFKSDVDILMNDGADKNQSIIETIGKFYEESKKILFNGNNYSADWVKEAEERGLSNITNTPDALSVYLREESIELFERNNVLTRNEIVARYNVFAEEYIKRIDIESHLIEELARTMIIPSAINYQNELIKNVKGLKDIGLSEESFFLIQIIKEISYNLKKMKLALDKLNVEHKSAHAIKDLSQEAVAFSTKVKPVFDEIRFFADKLEMIVEDKHWSLPKYRELLFLH